MAIEIKIKTFEIWNHRSQLEFIAACQYPIRKLNKDTTTKKYGLVFNFYTIAPEFGLPMAIKYTDLILEQMRLFLAVKDTNSRVISDITIKIYNGRAENKIVIHKRK